MEAVEVIISIVAGVVTIIGAIYGFNKWVLNRLLNQRPTGLFLKDGNINLVYSSGGSFEILSPRHLSMSKDQAKAVFVIEKYATGSEMVNVDLKTGKWTELFSVEHFEIINSGKFKNNLLVGVSEVGDR